MGTPTMVQRLQGPALLSCGLTLIAGAAMLSSPGSLSTFALWGSACLVLGAWGQQRGRRQERQRSRHEHYEQALAALQATGQGVPGSTLLQSAFDHSASPMVITDALDRIVMANTAFTQAVGLDTKALLGKSAELQGMAPLRSSHLPGIDQSLKEGRRWSGESAVCGHDGQVHEWWLVVSALRDERGRLTHHCRVFQDVEPLKAQLRQMSEQARHDALTELPNRRAFSEHLFQAMARTRRYPKTLALMSVDLDGFKAVNDTFGHDVGDLLLKQTARRLMACVRTTDVVCRLGGDEFMVILEGAGMPDEVNRIGQRILTCLSESYTLNGHHIKATPSIGGVVHHVDESEQDLLRRADAAMYAAKHAGKSRMVLDLCPGAAQEVPPLTQAA
ncbi:MAG TPA: sensor domain-containing diguanylate cyclase [Aquabacterium sp.]|nr:sensor domain-containing diguanylate cyclase [Aquabacterium sp.]